MRANRRSWCVKYIIFQSLIDHIRINDILYFAYIYLATSLSLSHWESSSETKNSYKKKTLLTKQLEDCLKKSGYAFVNVIYLHKQKYKFCRECVNVVLQCIKM